MKARLGRNLFAAVGVAVMLSPLVLGCEAGVKVTSIKPHYGTVAGGENIVITGSGFKAGVQVRFCDAEATNVTILGSKEIQCMSPANEKGECDLTITFDDGKAFKVAKAFRYLEPSELMQRNMLGTKAGQK